MFKKQKEIQNLTKTFVDVVGQSFSQNGEILSSK
jgi:hypothetical protein